MVLFFWNGFAPDSLFTCLPIIACILSYHVWCQVVSQKAMFIFVSLRTLLFVLNKTDSKLLQVDYFISSVRIETDVHLKQYLCFCRSNDCLEMLMHIRVLYLTLPGLYLHVTYCKCVVLQLNKCEYMNLNLNLWHHMMANADNLITISCFLPKQNFPLWEIYWSSFYTKCYTV